MRTPTVLIALVISLSYGCRQVSSKGDEDQIRQLESDWSGANATGECVEHKILADDFLGTSENGKHYNKAGIIAECQSKGAEMQYEHLDELRARLIGAAAVAWGSDHWERKDGKLGRYVWTDVLVKRAGRWQIVAAHDMIPPAQ